MLGGAAVLLFAILIFRMWFLQVLTAGEYVAMAEDNRIRYVREEAPRGIVYDRGMQPLVENRAGLAVTLFPTSMKDPERELAALSQAIGVPVEEINKELELHNEETYQSVIIKKDITPEEKSYLIERIPLYFPGVDIKKFPLRSYPFDTQVTHVLGHVGQIDKTELEDPWFAGHNPGDEVGKDGIEYQYDRYLKGVDGGKEIEVDAEGRPKRELRSIAAQPGNNVVLTIDSRVQKLTQDALVAGIKLAHSKNYPATGGAVVVMNPQNGEIYGMASYPNYDPNVWVGGMSESDYQQLTAEGANDPLLNRAIAGQYPPASTFKSVTAVAGLQEGMISNLNTFICTGVWNELSQPFKCWDDHGTVDLHKAIVQSCDTYFYNVGYRFYQAENQGIQKWARQLGLGRKTGIDIPGEAVGRIPDPAWKQEAGQTEEDQMWMPGDSVNLSIGQGDLLATPIQMATLYSGIANGGYSVTPHLGLRVEDETGKQVADLRPPAGVNLGIDSANLKAIQDGLAAATAPGATVGDTFVGFPVPVAGKTGTAQVAGKTDYAWFVSYAPANNPQVMVAVLIEQGGGGGSVAAPTARMVLDGWFKLNPPVQPSG